MLRDHKASFVSNAATQLAVIYRLVYFSLIVLVYPSYAVARGLEKVKLNSPNLAVFTSIRSLRSSSKALRSYIA